MAQVLFSVTRVPSEVSNFLDTPISEFLITTDSEVEEKLKGVKIATVRDLTVYTERELEKIIGEENVPIVGFLLGVVGLSLGMRFIYLEE